MKLTGTSPQASYENSMKLLYYSINIIISLTTQCN